MTVIIGMLASIVLPVFLGQEEKSVDADARAADGSVARRCTTGGRGGCPSGDVW